MNDRARPDTLMEQEARAMHDLLATNGRSAFVFVVTMKSLPSGDNDGSIVRGYGNCSRTQAIAYADLLDREAARIRSKIGVKT